MSTPNENKPVAPVGPWREGRPSFKAFYPEIFGLTVLTIAFVALAAKWSCSAKPERPAKDAPKAVSVDAPLLGAVAFAQDASIDAETTAPAETAAPVETAAPAETTAPVETAAPAKTAAPVETAAPAKTAAPVETAAKSTKSAKFARVLWIWIACLLLPAILWIWRGCVWLYAIYGIKFKIVCDPDNLKATTFLVVRGLFNKRTDSLHIAQIKDIQSSQSLWQKYLQGGIGTIRLTTSDVSDPVLELKNMDEPSRVFNAFDELRRHYWGRGGMQLNSGSVEVGDSADAEFHEM